MTAFICALGKQRSDNLGVPVGRCLHERGKSGPSCEGGICVRGDDPLRVVVEPGEIDVLADRLLSGKAVRDGPQEQPDVDEPMIKEPHRIIVHVPR